MERPDFNDASMVDQKCDDLEIAQWQWQSDKDPYPEADSAKWTWQNYLDDDNLIIEEAYSLGQEIAELKDYEIDLKKGLQVHKQDRNRIRRVRRQGPSRFMMKIPEATVIRNEKTMNEAFGTIQHFLEFIMKRTPEVFAVYNKLAVSSLDWERTTFEDLITQVVFCIGKAAETRAKVIKVRIGSRRVPNYILEAKKVTNMLEENSSTLRDFLRTVLKIYTMETFICYWLNELLRSEDWEEINILTPYLVCLAYTFKLPEYVLRSENSQMTIVNQPGFAVKKRLYLFRGAALTKEHLRNYNPEKVKYFSWNAVTSTSRDRSVALKFIDISLNKTKTLKVLFCIEIDFFQIQDYHGIIDISMDSMHPKEQEVILAPGTVFEMLDISIIEDSIYEIRLKATKVFKEAHNDSTLLGIQQDQAILEDKAIIEGLPSEKGFRILELVRGNKLISKLEIRDSGLEEKIIEKVESMRVTTNVRKQDIKLVDNNIVISSFHLLDHYFSVENLSEILQENKIRFGSEIDKVQKKLHVKELALNDKAIEMFHKNHQLKELWRRLKNEIQTQRIKFSIEKIQTLSDDELRGFFEYIEECKPLESLELALNKNQMITIENFNSLYQVISSSQTLSQLSLKFSFSDGRLSILFNAIKSLKCLKSLCLVCHDDYKTFDEGLGYLKSALILLTSLQILSLDFYDCIPDRGLKSLQKAFISPKKLFEHFFSDFLADSQTSDQSQNSLMSASIFLTNDNCFSLYFEFCQQNLDRNSYSLTNYLSPAAELQGILLDLYFSNQIKSQNLHDSEGGFIIFPFCSDLSIDFKAECWVSDEQLDPLAKALILHKYLKRLSIDFKDSFSNFEKYFDHLKSGLTSLKSLHCLSLSFGSNQAIISKELIYIKREISCFDFIIYSEDRDLYSKGYNQISDPGLAHLKDALISLLSLKSLSLDFSGSRKISDEGLRHLAFALESLVSLKQLSLNFSNCYELSVKGLNYLKSSFTSLITLQSLSLNFGFCHKIPSEEKHELKNALTSLPSLENIFLYFCSMKNHFCTSNYWEYRTYRTHNPWGICCCGSYYSWR